MRAAEKDNPENAGTNAGTQPGVEDGRPRRETAETPEPHDQLTQALALAADGFAVFPLYEPIITDGQPTRCSCGKTHDKPKDIGKHPRVKWKDAATRDLAQIRAWWQTWPTANIAIATGSRSGVFVLDEDAPGAADVLAKYCEGRLPATRRVRTGRGLHTYLRYDGADIRTCTDKAGDEIARALDIRGEGGYVVAPGSLHVSGHRYAWEDSTVAIASAPAGLVAVLRKPDPDASTRNNRTKSTRRPPTLADVAALLDRLKPERCSHHDDWLKVCQIIHSVDPGEDGYALAQEWSQGSAKYDEAEWEPRGDVWKRWRSFDAEGGLTIGTLHEMANADDPDGDPDACVAALNERYGIVLVGGKVRVLQEGGPEDGYALLSPADFRHLLGNRWVGKRRLPDVWLDHPRRREFPGGIVFEPGATTPGAYNLWRGWAVEPGPGNCSRFLDHLRENVCQGDAALYAWVLGWFAWLVRYPTKKLDTSLVLRGKQGTGKSIVGDVIGGKLLGERYWKVAAQPRFVTGHFNSHLATCLLLQAEEAFWANDKAAEGALKHLVTGKMHLLEHKGVDPIMIPNYVRLFVTSNAEWVVPAGMEERRFAVLDVGEARMQDHAYFGAMRDQLERENGYAALMQHLLGLELDEAALRRVPSTDALADQKRASLSIEHSWLQGLLVAGVLPGDAAGTGVTRHNWLWEHYVRTCKKRGFTHPRSDESLGSFLKKVIPGVEKRRVQHGKTRYMERVFPPLATARAQYTESTGYRVEWGDGADEWASATGVVDDDTPF